MSGEAVERPEAQCRRPGCTNPNQLPRTMFCQAHERPARNPRLWVPSARHSWDLRSKVEDEKFRLRVRDQARIEYAEEQAADGADDWYGTTGDEFDPDTPEPEPCVLEYAPDQYALAEGVNWLFGLRSALKTWLTYVALLQEAMRGHPVLLIDYEMSRDEAMRRMHTLGQHIEGFHRDVLRHVVYVHPVGILSDAGRARLVDRFGGGAPTVVGLDSVGMAMAASGLDPDRNKDCAEWAVDVPRWMKEQWPRTVQVLIDHVPKGSGAAVNDPIGAQRKGGYADGLYQAAALERISRRTRGTGRLWVRKDRKGWTDEGAPLLDYKFGGGGPFELALPDPDVAAAPDDIGAAADQLREVARWVGEHEGEKVQQARDALGVRAPDFTLLKSVLHANKVIDHRSRQGLFRGERWQQYMDGTYSLTDET